MQVASLTDGGDVGSFEDGETRAVPPLSLEGSLALLASRPLCNFEGHHQVRVLLADIDSLVVGFKELEAVCSRHDNTTAATAANHQSHQYQHTPGKEAEHHDHCNTAILLATIAVTSITQDS